MQATLQRAVSLPASLRGNSRGSFHFHCTAIAAPCSAGVCLYLFLLLNVVYLPIYAKLGLVVGMTKIMLTERRSVDMIFLGLTIHYVYHITIYICKVLYCCCINNTLDY